MKRRVGVIFAVGLSTLLIYACADSNTGTPGTGDDSGTESDGFTIEEPEDTGTKTDAKKDSGKKDASPKDAAKPDTGSEGDPCPPNIFSESDFCGKCGTRERVCLGSDDGGGGTLVWGAWGGCVGELATPDSCMPGTTLPDVDCGNCGKAKQVCQPDCHLEDPVCIEPSFGGIPACKPGSVEFKLGASCTGINEGRAHTCQTDCQWNGFGSCQLPPANTNVLAIGTTVGKVVTKQFKMLASNMLSYPDYGSCPTTLDSTFPLASTYVEVKNTTAKTAVVSIWHSNVTAGFLFFTSLAVYDGPYGHVFLDDAYRQNCVGEVNDYCFTSPCVDDLGGLVLGDSAAVTIAPGKSISVYSGTDETTDQDFFLNIKTESFK